MAVASRGEGEEGWRNEGGERARGEGKGRGRGERARGKKKEGKEGGMGREGEKVLDGGTEKR